MGLLDNLMNSSDGLLGLSLLDAAGPSAVPRSFGQRLFSGLQTAKAVQQAEEDRKQKAALQGLQSQLMQAQIGDVQSQAQQRAAQAAQLQQQAQREAAFRATLAGQGSVSPQQALAAGGGPTQQNAAQIGAPKQPDWQGLALQYPGQVELIKKLAESKDFGAPEVARTIESTDANGRPVTLQFDRQGRPIGPGLPQWKAPQMVDTGGAIGALDPVSMQMLQQFKKTQTPDSLASNGLGWANFGLAKQRLAMEQDQPKGQYDAERGIMVDPRTGQATPVMQGGQPVGPKNKDLNDSQAKALLFGSRMQEADRLLNGLAAAGTNMPSLIKQGAEGVPLIGGALGAAANWGLASQPQQQVDQAQRDFLNAVLRRESGAVISPPEFDNARHQYFPQPGDGPKVIAQKAQNRALAIKGMLAEVPANRLPAAPSGGQRNITVDW